MNDFLHRGKMDEREREREERERESAPKRKNQWTLVLIGAGLSTAAICSLA